MESKVSVDFPWHILEKDRYMLKGSIEMFGAVNSARYWSLVALSQLLKCDPLETQTCPTALRYSNTVVGDGRTIGLDMRGTCADVAFNIKISILKDANDIWRFDSVLIRYGEQGVGVLASPHTVPELFPGYPANMHFAS